MTHKVKAHIAILIQISIIGLSYLFVKEGLKYTDALTQLSHRFIIASLGIWLVRSKMPHANIFTKEAIKDLLPLGIFYPVLFFSLQTVSLNYITTLEAGIISAIIPILILVLAMVFLKEKPTWQQKVAILLAFVGVIYINVNSQNQAVSFSGIGTILMFLSALSSAMYTISAKQVSKKYEAIDMTTFMLTFGMLIFTVISIVQHLSGVIENSYFEPLSNFSYIRTILYLGILSSLASSFLANYAVHHIAASTIGLFSNITPIITILAGVLILGESIHSYQVIGILIILVPIISINLKSKKVR